MYKYQGPREYNEVMKFGGGDYQSANESADIPSEVPTGVVGAASYTFYKFVKDLHAILKFNQWAVVMIFAMGFLTGSMITFLVALSAMKPEPVEVPIPQPSEPVEEVPVKEPEAKKTD